MEEAKNAAEAEFEHISGMAKQEVKHAPMCLHHAIVCSLDACFVSSPDCAAAGCSRGDAAAGSGPVVWEAACYGQRQRRPLQQAPAGLQRDGLVNPHLMKRPQCV